MNCHDLQVLFELLSNLPDHYIEFIARAAKMSEIELDTLLQFVKLMDKFK